MPGQNNAKQSPLIRPPKPTDAQLSASGQSAPTPAVKRVQPLFRCLGYAEGKAHRAYYVEIRGQVHRYRPIDMHGLGFLLHVYPYVGHWRAQFPARNRMGIDTKEALGWFIRECHKAGIYVPPAD